MLEHPQKRISVDSIHGIKVNADSSTTYRVAVALAQAFFNEHDGLFRKTGNIN